MVSKCCPLELHIYKSDVLQKQIICGCDCGFNCWDDVCAAIARVKLPQPRPVGGNGRPSIMKLREKESRDIAGGGGGQQPAVPVL